MSELQSAVPCPVCGNTLSVRMATGRKSGKPFIALICALDGRHFRGFIADREYLSRVAKHLEGRR